MSSVPDEYIVPTAIPKRRTCSTRCSRPTAARAPCSRATAQLVGDAAFWDFQRALIDQFSGSTITTDAFIALASRSRSRRPASSPRT